MTELPGGWAVALLEAVAEVVRGVSVQEDRSEVYSGS